MDTDPALYTRPPASRSGATLGRRANGALTPSEGLAHAHTAPRKAVLKPASTAGAARHPNVYRLTAVAWG